MSSSKSRAPWVSHSGRPGRQNQVKSNIVMLNDREFIVLVAEYQIYKYNSHRDEWTLFLDIPKPSSFVDRRGNSMTIDLVSSRIYLSSTSSMMVVMDIKSVHQSPSFPKDRSGYRIGGGGAMANVNGTIHKLGGVEFPYHMIWNEMMKTWENNPETNGVIGIENPQKIGDVLFNTLYFCEEAVVFVPSKNILLLFGGVHDTDGEVAGFWRYHVDSGIWEEISEKMDIRFDLNNCSTVLMANEQHVVIYSPGDPEFGIRSDIYVMDISDDEDYKLWVHYIQEPNVPMREKHQCQVARSSRPHESQLLTKGWIREMGTDHLIIPCCIINMIAEYGVNERVHLIGWIIFWPIANVHYVQGGN